MPKFTILMAILLTLASTLDAADKSPVPFESPDLLACADVP